MAMLSDALKDWMRTGNVTCILPWRRYIRNVSGRPLRAVINLCEFKDPVGFEVYEDANELNVSLLTEGLYFALIVSTEDKVNVHVGFPRELSDSMHWESANHALIIIVLLKVLRNDEYVQQKWRVLAPAIVSVSNKLQDFPHGVSQVLSSFALLCVLKHCPAEERANFYPWYLGFLAVVTPDDLIACRMHEVAAQWSLSRRLSHESAIRACIIYLNSARHEDAERCLVTSLRHAETTEDFEQCRHCMVHLTYETRRLDLVSHLGNILPRSIATCRSVEELHAAIRRLPQSPVTTVLSCFTRRMESRAECVLQWVRDTCGSLATVELYFSEEANKETRESPHEEATPGARPLAPKAPRNDPAPAWQPPTPSPRRTSAKKKRAAERTERDLARKHESIARAAEHARGLRERERARVHELERRLELVRLGDAIGRG